MTKQVTLQYCPQCGTPLAGKPVCPQCGFDRNNPEVTMNQQASPKIAKAIYLIGSSAWIATTFITLIFFIIGIFQVFSGGFWFLISSLLAFGLEIYILKPFSEQVKHKQYYYIVNDVWILGGFQFPKILPLSVVLVVLLQGYGGIIFLVPVIAISFFGPVKIQWKLTADEKMAPNQAKVPVEKASKVGKKSKTKPPKKTAKKPAKKAKKQTKSKKSTKKKPSKKEDLSPKGDSALAEPAE